MALRERKRLSEGSTAPEQADKVGGKVDRYKGERIGGRTGRWIEVGRQVGR